MIPLNPLSRALRGRARGASSLRARRGGPAGAVAALLAGGLLLPSVAHAFCGTFVGSAGDTLTNRASHVVIGRHDTETVLTLSMDYQGDAENFALILPMPVVLQVEDVSTPPAELVEAVRAYGDPRLVEYTCEQALGLQGPSFVGLGCGGALGCGDSSGSRDSWGGYGTNWDTASTVDVLNHFNVNGYELVVLSADDSAQLWTWLDTHGYAVPDGGRDVLQEYLDAGLFFVAVKIDLALLQVRDGWLPPLQFHYNSPFFGLPIRIGTISAEDAQEVIVSVFADEAKGQVGISNYPEVSYEHDCMADTAPAGGFGPWYEDRLTTALDGKAGWIREHSWPVYSLSSGYHCDPCTPTGDFTAMELAQLGAPLASDNVHLTRLRVRYTPEQANADLVFYFDNQPGMKDQQRYIDYRHELEFLWPTCDVGFSEDPGTCEQVGDYEVVSGGCGERSKQSIEVGAMTFLVGLIGLRRRAGRRS